MNSWMKKPTAVECSACNCNESEFMFCQEHKYDMNCQTVADSCGKFLYVSIAFPGSIRDVLAFEGSKLYMSICKGRLAGGLCLFKDNV